MHQHAPRFRQHFIQHPNIEGFGRPDDACMIARAKLPNGSQVVGAAWARIFPSDATGYGTIDMATPEVSISLAGETEA